VTLTSSQRDERRPPRSVPWDWIRGHDVVAAILIAILKSLNIFK